MRERPLTQTLHQKAPDHPSPGQQPLAKDLAKALTYAGTLPLAGAAAGLAFALMTPDLALQIATTYSAIIISFLAGIHWACYLLSAQHCPRNLFITSNIVALAGWLSLLVQPHPWGLLLQIWCFAYVLWLDWKLREAGVIPSWFFTLRYRATAIVLTWLMIMVGIGAIA